MGGGIDEIKKIEKLLELGCDKIVIGNGLMKNKNFIKIVIKTLVHN